MNKIHVKLISVVLTLFLSISVVVASSYAWMVLSSSPAVMGIQVGIGGGNTVLIAPDIREVAKDGTVYHYPGYFDEKMNFNQQGEYDYLQQIGHLNPVSTINGIDWVLPAYYSSNDDRVKQGLIPVGALKDISDFFVDSELTYANIPAQEEEKIERGNYIYMDFWVLSPASDYKLRVSTGIGAENGGSFVIDLPQPEATEQGYTLVDSENSPAAAVRVGFLANDVVMTDDTMSMYMESSYFDDRFLRLKGLYQEPNTGTAYSDFDRFTIYEPNGDFHPAFPEVNGLYAETKPLGLEAGKIVEKRMNLDDNYFLTVQRASTWIVPENSETCALEQRFQTAMYSGNWGNLELNEVADKFYNGYLQGQISPYVNKGAFVGKTENLYTQLNMGEVSLAKEAVGATDDAVIIELERNVPQRIRMFIWLEGQDMDCIDQIASSRFAVNIELACSDK